MAPWATKAPLSQVRESGGASSAAPGEADQFLRPTYQGSIDFRQPWLLSPRNSAGVGVST